MTDPSGARAWSHVADVPALSAGPGKTTAGSLAA